jgi:hypothetical protein
MFCVNLARYTVITITRASGFLCIFSVFCPYTSAIAANSIQTENANIGDMTWNKFKSPDNEHDMEGYANKDSVNIGGSINFYTNANPSVDSSYALTVYRLGWYKGAGARRVAAPVSRTSTRQIIPVPDPATGMVQANWTHPYTLNIPKPWVSGIYIVTLIGNKTGKGRYIPFVVRDINRPSNYLFQVSTITWQAYNAWGGKSLYAYNSDTRPVTSDTRPIPGANVQARKVSFNRPYDDWAGLGQLIDWEIKMLFFLEREGYDISYQTDTDTHVGNGGLLNHKAILSVGHNEYWSKAMRDNFELARAHGAGLGFFGANTCYWQIRMEPASAPLASQQNRTIAGYKGYAATEDPLAKNLIASDNNLVTALWRDPLWANRPENGLVGIMYSFWPVKGNIVTSKSDPKLANGTPSHWIYTGTGMKISDTFKGLLGYEADRIFNNGKTPANMKILATSGVPATSVEHTEFFYGNPAQPKAHMTIYTKICTAMPCQNPVSTVFATGSMQWAWGLDNYSNPVNLENPNVKQMTRNVLARMVNAPLPAK